MQIQAKIGGILYNRGGKPGSNYPDLELGKEFWKRLLGRASDYKSLIYNNNLLSITTICTICTNLVLYVLNYYYYKMHQFMYQIYYYCCFLFKWPIFCAHHR